MTAYSGSQAPGTVGRNENVVGRLSTAQLARHRCPAAQCIKYNFKSKMTKLKASKFIDCSKWLLRKRRSPHFFPMLSRPRTKKNLFYNVFQPTKGHSPSSLRCKAGHNRRQFDESTTNLSIDIVDCRLSIGLRRGVVGSSLQNEVLQRIS